MTNKQKCIYCNNITDEPHFQSDCCGRGMCDDCYNALQDTNEQIQVDFMDDDDYETIKDEYKDANYLCFECTNVWRK